VDLARQLIEALTTAFQPEKYPDRRRQQLEAMIERKAKGKRVVLPPPAELEEGVYDLMAALEKSVAAAKKATRPAVKRGTQRPVRRRKCA
jgi:DNA end-binding protein Ku